MKVLYSAADIHNAIKQTLTPTSRGRRVVLVAYVGEGAEAFLPAPKGVDLVCSLAPGSTSSVALSRLINRGARVRQSNRLHMKVYWSETNGCVICSANASTSALGRGGLKEAGVWLPSRQVDIERLLRHADPKAVSAPDLIALGRESDRTDRRFKRQESSRALVTFPEWMALMGTKRWKVGWWQDSQITTAAAAKAESYQMYGVRNPAVLVNTEKGRLSSLDWLLCFRTPKVTNIEWMHIDFVSKVKPSEKGAYERDYPYQAVQVHGLARYPDPPFRIDSQFRRALRSGTEDFGVARLEAVRSLVPPAAWLRSILSRYRST